MSPTDDVLLRFVRESNLIEGYVVGPGEGDKIHDEHMKAALWVRDMSQRGIILDSRDIHRMMLWFDGHINPGHWRREPIGISDGHGGWEEKMKWWDVPTAMIQLMKDAEWHVNTEYDGRVSSDLWQLHLQFEHIHPFIDGNGRVGRLLLNNHRLVAGLDWHTVYNDKKQAYYDTIKEYENKQEG